ncbi:hypothetical protein [Streptomyces sp. NBC_00687]|uniref:hypothetical protein n=1 Tax=Streptomyces sp. NBC_00687 TaxID=2975807 RepID=UPI00225122D0|nr:hypothetical protein [Streptomyces sp. NBC_00687]MCX4916540.1 hypothetical protein [Streptomyces sp. NBC_00687]
MTTRTTTRTTVATNTGLRGRVAGALAAAALLGGGLAMAPAASAAVQAPAADSCTQSWSISSGQGYANGWWCNYDTKVTGTVHDTKSDGRCPFVRGKLTNGGHVDSNWAGPKGDSSPVTLKAPSGTSFSSLSMSYIVC